MLDKLKTELNYVGYSYYQKNNSLITKLGYGLRCKIEYNDNQVKISGYLKRWNFLTGLASLNLKWLMTYNLIWFFIFLFIQLYFKSGVIKLPYIPFIILAWFLVSNFYYYFKYFYFKSTLIYMVYNIKNK
ncbi:hypothetical protein [Formosa maritima]|uniref:Uncharacterized protein n=1 Tax=Formosa maritima TaxID=2592046 RepID=A0A5D0GM29_9FLAO|nr:hypothetical protein [Formosa maritima]TYA60064.1 hypothetical protein FVF61_00125 [Formosa maritima]